MTQFTPKRQKNPDGSNVIITTTNYYIRNRNFLIRSESFRRGYPHGNRNGELGVPIPEALNEVLNVSERDA
jgi:hypothetical protein